MPISSRPSRCSTTRGFRQAETAVITNAGYEKTNAADNIGDLEIAELSEETKGSLRAVLPPFVGIESFLDVTPMVSDEVFREVRRDPDRFRYGGLSVHLTIVPHAGLIHTTDQEMLEYKNNVAAGIVDVAHSHASPSWSR
jgi:acyl-CoA synthetase (NDP forming)